MKLNIQAKYYLLFMFINFNRCFNYNLEYYFMLIIIQIFLINFDYSIESNTEKIFNNKY